MSYTLYKPKELPAHAALVVMLHGCSQSPEDCAIGTRLNTFADRHGFCVLYPAQSAGANAMGCWNWFDPKHQIRDHGEPGLLADLTRGVAADHALDPRRIFVAGFSAGGAMAVILGTVYPEVFAAVGVHSGLPYAAAHGAASALAAMGGHPAGHRQPSAAGSHAVPTLVFHGDQDTTVDASNGTMIVDQAVACAQFGGADLLTLRRERQAAGRMCTTVIYQDPAGRPLVEYWLVHGAGHAWSGGSPSGSFTDPQRPDASAEMVRFFFAQTAP